MHYRDKKGRFASFPHDFLEKVIKPSAKRNGQTVKEYIKANKDNLVKLLKANKSEFQTNKIGVEKLITRLDDKTHLYIYNGKSKYKCTKLELREYIAKIWQQIMELDIKYINFKYVQINGFETVIFILPDSRVLQQMINNR